MQDASPPRLVIRAVRRAGLSPGELFAPPSASPTTAPRRIAVPASVLANGYVNPRVFDRADATCTVPRHKGELEVELSAMSSPKAAPRGGSGATEPHRWRLQWPY